MSNLNDDRERFDPRMRNGWAEYQRLVLAELERHNNIIEGFNAKLNDIALQIALLKQENGKIAKLEQRLDDTTRQLDKLSQGDMIEDAVHRYRNWLISIGFLLVTALAVPIVKLFIGGG